MADEVKQKVTTWVHEVFKNRNYDELKVKFLDTDTTGGYAAEMIYVDVVGSKNGNEETTSIIVKKGRDSSVMQDTLMLSRAYASEVRLYAKYLPYLQKFAEKRNVTPFNNIPFCYGTVNTDNQYVVFMENLKVKNYKLHDIQKTLDLNHIKLILKAYAKVHALWLALKDQEPETFDEFKGECGSNIVGSKVFEFVIETAHKELESVIDIYKAKEKLHIIDKLNILKQNHERVLGDSLLGKDEDYQVLRHGDCWNNNYLFHYNEVGTDADKVVIIDWQMGLFGSPLADIACFLFFCCSRKELEHLEDLLTLYHDEVSTNLKQLGSETGQCFPWKICQYSFKRYTPIALVGMPQAVKLSCQVQLDKTYDLADAAEEGNFCKIFGGELRDPEEYFNRIDSVFELCIEKGLL